MTDKVVQVGFAKMEKLIMGACHTPSTVKGTYQLGAALKHLDYNKKNCTHLGCQRGLGLHTCPDIIEWKHGSFGVRYANERRLPPVYSNKDWNKS